MQVLDDTQPRPGQAAICKACLHHIESLARIGHVNPCKRVNGGKKDQRPKLVRYADGREECDQHNKLPGRSITIKNFCREGECVVEEEGGAN
jgi:nitric oxide synthase oxygenase domain/subunit